MANLGNYEIHSVSENTTYAYVNVDINASIELKVDRDLNVLEISAQNKEAEQLVEDLAEIEKKQLEPIIFKFMTDSEKHDLVRNGKQILIGVNDPSPSGNRIKTDIKAYFKEADTRLASGHIPDPR